MPAESPDLGVISAFTAVRLCIMNIHALRFEMLSPDLTAMWLRMRVRPCLDHQSKLFEMFGMNKADRAFGVASQRPHIQHPTRTFLDLNAFVFVRYQIQLFVTHRTGKRGLFHTTSSHVRLGTAWAVPNLKIQN